MKRLACFVAALTAASILVTSAAPSSAGSPAEGKKKKKRTEKYDPMQSLNLMRQGSVYFQQGLYDDALKRFMEADRVAPDNATVYNMIGLCYLNMERHDRALEAFDHALELNPSFSDARNNRGTTYLALEQYRMAEVDFVAVLSDNTYRHRWEVYFNLGMTYFQQGRNGAAEENFRKAIIAPVPVYEAYLRLAELNLLRGQADETIDLLEEARLKYPDRPEASLQLGRTLCQLGRCGEARPYLEDVLASVPNTEMAREASLLLGTG